MSQHFITEFINRTYVFKPLYDAKIVNHKVKKYQGSDRKNHVSPELFVESPFPLQSAVVKNKKEEMDDGSEAEAHIDITI